MPPRDRPQPFGIDTLLKASWAASFDHAVIGGRAAAHGSRMRPSIDGSRIGHERDTYGPTAVGSDSNSASTKSYGSSLKALSFAGTGAWADRTPSAVIAHRPGDVGNERQLDLASPVAGRGFWCEAQHACKSGQPAEKWIACHVDPPSKRSTMHNRALQ